MDKIITFNPVIEWRDYVGAKAFLRMALSKKILKVPRIYVQNIAANVGAQMILNEMRRELGIENIWNVLKEYRNHPKRPHATVFYGDQYKLDVIQTSLISDLPEVHLVALPYDDHNCGAYLKQRGELGTAIAREVDTAYNKSA
jgi:hypothetical protein